MLAKIAATPVLASELPAGLTVAKISRLAPIARLHTLGAIGIDLHRAHETDSVSYALLRTNAAAAGLARTEARVNGHGLFHATAVAVGRIAVAATASTAGEARSLLHFAVAHLRRAER